MKTERVLIIVLSLLVIALAYLAFRKKPEEMSHPTTVEPSRATSVEMWQTNVVERWRTNTEVLTNTIVQTVTNEVIKEVPAKLSAAERQAAVVGYKYIHAPVLEDVSDALYKLGPVTVDLYVDASSATLLGENMDELKTKVEAALQSRNVHVQDQSPDHLRVNVSPRWRMSDPEVGLVSCSVELVESTALDRQGDIVKRPSVVWSKTASKFVRTIDMVAEVDKCIQDPIDKFCDDYLQAKEHEKNIQSRLPTIAPGFLSGSE